MESLLFRPRRRLLTALLAAWVAVFMVVEAVHTHGPLVQAADHASLDQATVSGSQPNVCLACLAAQTPVPAAGPLVVLPVRQEAEETRAVENSELVDSTFLPAIPPRAPPALPTTQA